MFGEVECIGSYDRNCKVDLNPPYYRNLLSIKGSDYIVINHVETRVRRAANKPRRSGIRERRSGFEVVELPNSAPGRDRKALIVVAE